MSIKESDYIQRYNLAATIKPLEKLSASIYYYINSNSDCTYAEFGKKIGVSKSSVGMYSLGLAYPKADTLYRLSKEMGVPIDDICGLTFLKRLNLCGSFKENINKLMKLKEISVSKLSSETGLSRPTVRNLTLGKNTPTADTCILLSIFFNVSLDSLIGEWQNEIN